MLKQPALGPGLLGVGGLPNSMRYVAPFVCLAGFEPALMGKFGQTCFPAGG